MVKYLPLFRPVLFATALIAFSISALGQTIQSSGGGTGNWNDPLSWTPNTVPTNANSTSIIINAGHTITVTANVSIDQATISAGGVVNISGGVNLTVAAGAGDDLTIDGTLNNSGTLTSAFVFPPPPPQVGVIRVRSGGRLNNAGIISGASTSTLIFNGGAMYDHQQDGGAIPTASWNPGASPTSTCLISGVLGTVPSGLNQNFGDFTWNCTGQSGFIDFNGSLGPMIGGDVSFQSTNGSATYLTSSTDYSLTVNGDFTVNGGYVGLNSTATSASLTILGDYSTTNATVDNSFGGGLTMDVEGNFTHSGGVITYNDFSLGGNITINVAGDFSLTSSPTINNDGSGSTSIFFDGSSVQTYTASQAFTGFSYTIENGSTVDAGSSQISGSGDFTLEAGATLRVGDADGLSTGTSSGNVRVSGTRTYTANANIIYDGTTQNLGNEWGGSGALNGVAVNLEIADGAIVTNNIIGSTSLVGNLTLTSGTLNIGNSNTLQIQSDFNGNGGNLGGVATSNLTFSGSGAITGLLSFASGARNLNNFTIDRSGTLDLGSDLTIGGTLSFASTGNLNIDQFNGQTLTINGDITQGGSGSLITGSNFTSNLVIGGSGALSSLPICTVCGTMQLNNLTLGRTGGGTYTWNSTVTILNAVNLNSGTLTHTSGLTMGAGSTFNRNSGSSISSSPLNSGAYNISYNGTLTTGPELPLSTTAINNLTIGGDVTLNKDITVNGILTFSSGTFNAGSNLLDIKGNLVSNASSTLTSSDITFSGTTVISGISAPVFGDITITGTLTPSSNFNINGNLVNNGTLNAGSATVTFGGTTTISGSSTHNFNSVAITGTLNGPANMNVSGNWNNTGTFNPGIASNTVTFNGTTSFAGNGLTQFSSVIIANSATLNSRPVLPLNVAGNFTNNGTFVAGTGTLLLNGTSVQSIAGTTTTTFNNITVTNAAMPLSVRVQSNQSIRGILTLSSNTTFDADGSGNTSIFTLLSSADDPSVTDAAIAELPSGAQVTGNVTVQRYMSIEGGSNSPGFDNGRIYRYISSPVASAPVSQIQVFNPVTGTFTGSSTCTGCTTTQSMFLYNESVITDTNGSGTPDLNDGYEDFPSTSNTETLATGRGYAMFVWGNVPPVSTAGNALWSVRNTINAGTIDFVASAGASFTAGNGLANDGWNLVGNPYPSTIDWDAASGWTKTGLTNTIYMKDNGALTGTYASYVGGVGGTNGGSRYIPIGQAFWVKATSSPTFQATEAVKAPGNTTTFFRTSPPSDLMRVTLRNGLKRDEIIIYFDEEATEEFDGNGDAYKLKNDIFNLSTVTPLGDKLAINGLPMLECNKTLGLDITNVTAGNYRLDFTEFESFITPVNIFLVDKQTGENIDVKENASYEFVVTAEESSYKDRFELNIINTSIDPTLLITATNNGTSCKEGAVTISAEGAPAGGSYRWYENETDVAAIAGQNSSVLITPVLEKSKTYFVAAVSQAGCEGARVPVMAEVINFDDVTLTDSGDGTLSSNYAANNQWFKDGEIIPGATEQNYTPTESGVYKVQVAFESCTSSAERVFTVTGIEDEMTAGWISMYPNPVEDRLTIELNSQELVNPVVVDMLGRQLGTVKMEAKGQGYVGSFDFKGHADGFYLLKVSDSRGKLFTKRIIKK